MCDSELFDDGGGLLHSGRTMFIAALASSMSSGARGFTEVLAAGLSLLVGVADMFALLEEPAHSSMTRSFSEPSLEPDEDSDRRGFVITLLEFQGADGKR